MENDKEMSEEHKVTQQIAENETARTVEQMQAHSAEEREEHEDHAEHTVDYSGLSKKQLLEEMRELLRKADYLHTDAQVHELRAGFDEICERGEGEALQHLVAEGGAADD